MTVQPNDLQPGRIARVVTRLRRGDPKTDAAYWRSLPPEARIAALEQIRTEYHRWKYHAEPRFQRVYSIENLKKNKKASGRAQDIADLENLAG